MDVNKKLSKEETKEALNKKLNKKMSEEDLKKIAGGVTNDYNLTDNCSNWFTWFFTT